MPISVPNYLTTNPDGTVDADFSGHVTASGLDLLGTTAFADDRAIRWLRQNGNGNVVAAMFEQDLAPDQRLYIICQEEDPSIFGDPSVQLQLEAFASLASFKVQVVHGAKNTTIPVWDENRNSGFLTWGSGALANAAVFAGNTAAITTGTAAFVNPGFGGGLLCAVVQPLQIGTVGHGSWNVDYPGAGNFRIYNNTGFNVPFAWIAIGSR